MPGSRRGFALVLSLGLMAMLLLLMVALSTLVQIEVNVASGREVHARAQANARFALHQALGELQRVAGPDQRQSARADILGVGVAQAGNHYWTGIWDATSPLSEPSWLVSGAAPDPRISPADAATLVPAHAPAGLPAVTAPTVALDLSDGWEHRIAWWVGDEGVKASLQPGRTLPEGVDALTAAAHHHQLSSGCDIERFFRDDLMADSSILAGLERMNSLRQLPLLRTREGRSVVTQDTLRARWHDYTLCAYGVLENPAGGGLKHNLSDPAYRDGDLINDAMRAFLTPSMDYRAAATPVDRAALNDGETTHALYPIPTELTLKMRVFHGYNDARVKLRYHVEIEFWNPYSVPITFPEDDNDEGYSRAMAVYFDNLPELKIENRDSNDTPDIEDDLSSIQYYREFDVFDYKGILKQPYLCVWVDIAPDKKSRDAPVLQPGEVYRVMAPNPATQPEGLARDLGFFDYTPSPSKTHRRDVPVWADLYETRPEAGDSIRIKADTNGKNVDVHFVPFTGANEDYRQVEPFFSLKDLAYPEFEYKQRFGRDKNGDAGYKLPFSLDGSLDYRHEDATIVYHWKLSSDEDSLEELSLFLAALDLSNPAFDAGASITLPAVDDLAMAESEPGTRVLKMADLMELELTEPRNSYRGMNDYDVFEPRELFHDTEPRNHDNENLSPVLFDLPLTEPLTVGVMRYAQIAGTPTLALGNPQAGGMNRVFDQYFFNPYYQAESHPQPIMLHGRLAPANGLAGDGARADDAARLYQLGAFNLNSTSVEAWRAMLGSSGGGQSPQDDDAMGYASGSRVSAHSFARQPFRAAIYSSQLRDEQDIAQPRYAFTESVRTLSAREGHTQLDYLAGGIVARLQSRGRPFATVQEFVNSGIIAEALADVGQRPGMDDVRPINEGLLPFSNLTLTQGDIISRLAPVLNARSDTFVIRAYGEAVDPLTGDAAKAWCEATVRRTPDRLDGGAAMDPTVAGTLGRKFEVIDFRWISAEEMEPVAEVPVFVSNF